MRTYWNKRFLSEKRIWGDNPSKTVEYAKELFAKANAKTVLVPGAGYGRNAELFGAAGFVVTGIELSNEALKLARERDSSITYYQGSVLDMPFSDETYDAIYCFNVLHLFEAHDRRQFLMKCYNQLNKNGLAFFAVFSEKEPSYGRGAEVEQNTFESKPGRPVHYFTEDDFLAHFKDFAVIEAGILEDPEDHGNEGPHIHLVRYIYARKS